MKSVPLNISSIKSSVKKKHEELLNRLNPSLNKVVSDHYLRLEGVSSKLCLIFGILKEAEVIDSNNIQTQGSYRRSTLQKNGYSDTLEVYTDGEMIVLSQDNCFIGSDMHAPYKKVYRDVWNNFSWEKFTEELVESIHVIVYKSHEANEVKFKGIFQDPTSKGQ